MSAKIGMISLGCPKNQVDGEMMLARLQEEGHTLVSDADGADIVIVNTCGFIEDAKKEAIENILEMLQLKKEGSVGAVLVTGCLAQRYQDEVLKEMPELDGVLGLGANGDIVQMVRDILGGQTLSVFPEKEEMPLGGERILTTPRYTAYLRVADGCDNCCSYCAIPSIRGCFRSRTMEDIVEEAQTLAKRGVKELIVIAQDTTRYGQDLYGELMLPRLLDKLCTLDGIEWIRLLYCYPDRVTDELLAVMASQKKIVKYLDLPLQHVDSGILKAMNRRGSKEELTKLIRHIREKVPGIALRTTFIVGFPGESGRQFASLAEFVRDLQFEHMGCFTFSSEEGTPACEMGSQIDDEIKTRRQEILMEEQAGIVSHRFRRLKNQTLRVLTEGFDQYAECWVGRTEHDAPDIDGKVFFTASGPLQPGDFVNVTITGAMDYDLIGELAE